MGITKATCLVKEPFQQSTALVSLRDHYESNKSKPGKWSINQLAATCSRSVVTMHEELFFIHNQQQHKHAKASSSTSKLVTMLLTSTRSISRSSSTALTRLPISAIS